MKTINYAVMLVDAHSMISLSQRITVVAMSLQRELQSLKLENGKLEKTQKLKLEIQLQLSIWIYQSHVPTFNKTCL